MLPGSQGPKWISCTRLVSRDLDSGQIIEDRPVSEITERERRMEFRGGRNIKTTFTYRVTVDTQPHQWTCSSCGHCGCLRALGTCEACGDLGRVRQVTRGEICVVHREADGKAYARGDVSGTELNFFISSALAFHVSIRFSSVPDT